MSILTLEHISYDYKNKYHKVEALKNINVNFEIGRLYGIIGKSGSGKSTLLKLLSGLMIPKEGSIYYNGEDLSTMDRYEYRRNKASVIYQDFGLFPKLTALENVMYSMELNGMNKVKAKVIAMELLKQMEIKEHCFKHFPDMLSGGEQQRVAIARALGTNSKIILADEPTGNLDKANSAAIVSIFKELAHKKGHLIIVVTHDVSIIDELDVVYEMSDGELELILK